MQASLERWMDDLSDEEKRKPLNELVLPGTHNSGAYISDYSVYLAKNGWTRHVSRLAHYLAPLRHYLNSLILCQNLNITNQLELGIRSFDLRITSFEDSFFVSHTFCCIELREILEQFVKFIATHQSEVILIRAKPDWPHRHTLTPQQTENLHRYIISILGEFYYDSSSNSASNRNSRNLNEINDSNSNARAPRNAHASNTPSNTRWPSISDLIRTNQRIIFIYDWNHRIERIPHKNLFVESAWFNSNQTATVLLRNNDRLQDFNRLHQIHDRGGLIAVSFVLTPHTKDYVLTAMCVPRTLQRLSNRLHDELEYFIEEHSTLLLNANLIEFDFPTDALVSSVIQLNFHT